MILSEEDHKVLNQFSGLDKKANSEEIHESCIFATFEKKGEINISKGR